MIFHSKFQKYLLLSLVCVPVILWFENCTPSNSFDASSTVDGATSMNVATPLGGLSATSVSIAPSSQTVSPGSAMQLYATGGTPPYTFRILSGSGAVTQTGIFVAPTDEEVVTIQAMDSTGQISNSIITVSASFGSMTSETPIYQFIGPATGEHYYSTSYAEGAAYGYTYQGTAFMVVTSSTLSAGFIGLYRCVVSGGYHFLSADPACEGQAYETTLGYIYSSQLAGTTPLYRYYLSTTGDYLSTINAAAATAAGYTYLGVIGYVPTQ